MKYTDEFEAWWKYFNEKSPSVKGRKYEAFMVWKDLDKSGELPELVELIEGVRRHRSNDTYFSRKNQFVPAWQHGCRWLKNRSWEVEDEMEQERQRVNSRKQKPVKEEPVKVEETDYAQLAKDNHDNRFYQEMASKLRRKEGVG